MIDVKKLIVWGMTLVILLTGIGTVSAFTNLVQNPSFELPPMSDSIQYTICPTGTCPQFWTIGNNENVKFIRGLWWDKQDGAQSIDLSGNTRGSISQEIPTTPSETYLLSFYLSGNFLGGSQDYREVSVYWGGNLIGSQTFEKPFLWSRYFNLGWHKFAFSLPATGEPSPTELKFVDTTPGTGNYGVVLDNIIVVPSEVVPVPEFPTFALPVALIVGLLGAVLFIQRSKEN